MLFTLGYDMRAPAFGAGTTRLYQAALDQCHWADRVGFTAIALMEHHASIDGYLPSPIVMAAAVAARTQRLIISLTMVLPLYDAIRAAEDLAILDHLAQGRLSLVVGAGYREEEYEQFGLSIAERPARMELGVATLKQAWKGDPFVHEGRTVQILPRPHTPGGPPIILGGTSKAAAKRAARIADGFLPSTAKYFEDYRDELARLGQPVPPPLPSVAGTTVMFVHVSRDPERDWSRIGPHAMHDMNDYARWANGNPDYPFHLVRDIDEVRAAGVYLILTPEECIEFARANGGLFTKPLMGGLDPDIAWESLSLIESDVLPALGIAASTSAASSMSKIGR